MVKKHLNPGGVVTQWVPLYESDPATVKSEIATFFEVFPNGTIWGNDISGGGYDIVLLGQADPSRVDLDAVQARLNSPDGQRAAASLREVGFGNVMQMLATYAGRSEDLKPWLRDAEINYDSNLRLQYMAGLALNVQREGSIYSDMLTYRRYPSTMFAGNDDTLRILRTVLNSQ